MIPLAVPNLSGNEGRYLQECIETNFVSTVGPFVDRFERMLADAAGGTAAVATSSGTAGLHAALLAVGVQRDDLVIIPDFTFIATANAVAHCGAVPWLLDVAADSWTLDPDQLAEELATNTERCGADLIHRPSQRRIGAVMPVFTLGLPARMDRIVETARRHGLPVVADAAAALGATMQGRAMADLGADLTVVSFNGNKTLTAGGGGGVIGGDEILCRKVRHISTVARVGAAYEHDSVGYNYRMTNLQAAVACAQLERLDELVSAKRRIAATYARAFADLPGVAPFPAPGWAESACWMPGLRFLDPTHLPEVLEALQSAGIGCRPFWRSVHRQAPYRDAPAAAVPVADSLSEALLVLPCSTHLSEAEQGRVIATLRACLADGSMVPS